MKNRLTSCAKKKRRPQVFPSFGYREKRFLLWLRMLQWYGHRCYWCGLEMEDSDATRDHLIPIARGGADEMFNIVPACADCNSQKGDMTGDEYRLYRLHQNLKVPHWDEVDFLLLRRAGLLAVENPQAQILVSLVHERQRKKESTPFLDGHIERLIQELGL